MWRQGRVVLVAVCMGLFAGIPGAEEPRPASGQGHPGAFGLPAPRVRLSGGPRSTGARPHGPQGFLGRFAKGVVLDEVKRAPALFSYLQGIIDRDRVSGRFILTGSQRFLLVRNASQTLAGRVAVVSLLPFGLAEIRETPPLDIDRIDSQPLRLDAPPFTLEWLLRQGLYPAVHDTRIDARDWMPSYYRACAERKAIPRAPSEASRP